MKNLAYITIDESLTPLKAAEQLKIAKENGFESILVMHKKDAPFYTTLYKENLLSLFRAAYRNKVRLYISDADNFISGAGFGRVGTVRDVRPSVMCIKNKDEVIEGEKIIAEQDGRCVTVSLLDDTTAERLNFYPDLTNKECVQLVIDCVYEPLWRDYSKFVGYEFAGFFCNFPCPASDLRLFSAYMEAVVERFKKEHKREPNFFEIVEEHGDFDEYLRLARVCVEENFLSVLKQWCTSHGLELIVGSLSDQYEDYCKKNKLIHVSEFGAKDSYQMRITSCTEVIECAFNAIGGVMQIMPGMGKKAKLWEFFDKNSDAEVVWLDDFNNTDKDCYIIKSKKEKQVSFLLDGDWCILDWENDAIYDFDKKGVYEFRSNSFLCIRRKTADMYSEKLPARVGRVMTKELEYVKPVKFVTEGNKFKFVLPDENLSGKYIEFFVMGYYINVKMGYNRYESIADPFVYPLYDFLCGSECEVDVDEGELEEIWICEKKKD